MTDDVIYEAMINISKSEMSKDEFANLLKRFSKPS